MSTEYFTASGYPSTGALGVSASARSEFANIETGFAKLPTLAGNGSKIVAVNSGASALEAVTTTGTGNAVRATSPTLVTPILGTPTSGTLTNCTGLPVSTGLSGLGTGVAAFLATPSSANLASAVTSTTGSGALVFGTGPSVSNPTFTGVIKSADGSAAAPAYTFTSDTTMGIYRSGANEMSFAFNGNQYVKFVNNSMALISLGGFGTATYSTNSIQLDDSITGAKQVVGTRQTGWTAMTGSTNKATAYDTSTVTLAQLAGRVMAIQQALTTHGLIGA